GPGRRHPRRTADRAGSRAGRRGGPGRALRRAAGPDPRRPRPPRGDRAEAGHGRLAAPAAGPAAQLAGGAVHPGRQPRGARRRPPRGLLTMRHINELLERELAAYFLAPMAYLVLLAFQLVAFLNFWELVDSLSQPMGARAEFSSLNDPMTSYVSGSPAFWIAILVAIPALTMRLLAEERRSGTI